MELSSKELKNVEDLLQSQRERHHHADLNATNANAIRDNMDMDGTTDKMQNLALSLMDNKVAQRSISRTLANNSHPLMSPNGTDSDSEAVIDNSKCRNFPDLIPHNERRLPTSNPPAPPNTLSLNLNNVRGNHNMPTHNKLSLLRAHSPDILSSESDAEISQYQAAVEANFQSVSLIPNTTLSNKEYQESRKGGCGAPGREDISSLDSISNHSFDDDDDVEHNLASLSPSSSLMDGLDDDDDDDDDDNEDINQVECDGADDTFMDAATPKVENTSILPQYSASEEHRDSRNWQKITLPDGRVREIDMRVIEPYKRVLSHGGYLKAGGHNAIVIFCACHLPDHSRADYNYVMDNLFLYVVKTLEQLVTEDYVLIYLHGGSNRRNVPPFPWLKRCYQLLDRRLRKSLKSMYLVHPTFWIKSIVWMARPFVSAKFWRKLVYVKSLEELGTYVNVEKAAIPDKVKHYDAKQKT